MSGLEGKHALLNKKDELQDYYKKVRAIGDYIIDITERSGVHPFFTSATSIVSPSNYGAYKVSHGIDQIPFHGGIALEFEHGIPKNLLTPLGKLTLIENYICLLSSSEGGKTEVHENLLERLSKAMGLEPISTDTGSSVYYYITNFGGENFPQIDLMELDIDSVPQDVAVSLWNNPVKQVFAVS